jgi:hypothetical protein
VAAQLLMQWRVLRWNRLVPVAPTVFISPDDEPVPPAYVRLLRQDAVILLGLAVRPQRL